MVDRKRLIRWLERVHLAHWLYERIASLIEHITTWRGISAILAAIVSWRLPWVHLSVPLASTIALAVFACVLFWNIPVRSPTEDQQKAHSAETPELLLEYSTEGVKNHLTLRNDGSATIHSWNILPLKLTATNIVSSSFGHPPIVSKNTFLTEFNVEDVSEPLVDYLRTKAQKFDATLEVYYENSKAQGFIRTFKLETFRDGSLVLQPGSITPQPQQLM